jgi:polar amino acid transport system substrate-binding protein
MERVIVCTIRAIVLAIALAACSGGGVSSALAQGKSAHPGCEPDKVASKFPAIAGKTMRVGIAPDKPPGRYRDPKNPDKIVGYDPDLVEEVMSCLGVKYEFVATQFAGLIQGIQAGQMDLVWSNLFYTPERAKIVDFVLYQKTGDAVMVAKGNPKNVKSMMDLCGLRASASLGSVELAALEDGSAKCVAAGKPAILVSTYPNVAAVVRSLENNRADAICMERVSLDQQVIERPNDFERAFILEGVEFKIGAAVINGNDRVLLPVFDAVKAIQADGTHAKILQKHGVDPALELKAEIRRD